MTMVPAPLTDRVLARLDVARPTVDLAGLTELYGAWCTHIAFDNVQKMVYLAEGGSLPLPGSTSEAFFEDFLATGAGGTCWSGNGALHDLLVTLGFEVERVAATMMTRPDQPPCNHGSVLAHLAGSRYIVDASILSGTPMRLVDRDEQPSPTLPRTEHRGDQHVIVWRTPRAPEGFTCRIDRIGISAERWNTLHQHTARWSPFNYAVSARILRAGRTVGYVAGQRYAIGHDGKLVTEPCDRACRDKLLVEELGIDDKLVARLPDDREAEPAPADFAPLPP